METSFLLISNQRESLWVRMMVKVLSALGKLSVLPQDQAMLSIPNHHYDIVIIDISATDDEYLLAERVHSQKPQTRVIIATASPTWKRARKAFRAGVVDYISKTIGEAELLSVLKKILTKTPQIPFQ